MAAADRPTAPERSGAFPFAKLDAADLARAKAMLQAGASQTGVAAALGVHRSLVSALIARGALPPARVDARTRIDLAAAQALLDEGLRPPEVAARLGVSDAAINRRIRRGELRRGERQT